MFVKRSYGTKFLYYDFIIDAAGFTDLVCLQPEGMDLLGTGQDGEEEILSARKV